MNDLARRLLVLSALCALLPGCLTSGQSAQRDEERCAARGLQPKTDAFQDCVVRLESERNVRMESRRRDLLDKSSSPLPPLR